MVADKCKSCRFWNVAYEECSEGATKKTQEADICMQRESIEIKRLNWNVRPDWMPEPLIVELLIVPTMKMNLYLKDECLRQAAGRKELHKRLVEMLNKWHKECGKSEHTDLPCYKEKGNEEAQDTQEEEN